MTLTSFRIGPVAAAALAGLSGCVDRRFVVETNVPAAVYVNDRATGSAPADVRYDYAGVYRIKVVSPGYETLVVDERVRKRWYDYPGLDFFAEVLWPFRIEDKRRFFYTLSPAEQVRTDQLLADADALRTRGQNLPPPEEPPARSADGLPPPASVPSPVVIPPDEPLPADRRGP